MAEQLDHVIEACDLPNVTVQVIAYDAGAHPALNSTSIRSMIVFEQEIPPGGRSGAQKTPGGSVLYVLEGKGYTLLDGVRHDWQAEDLVNIPIRTEGVVVQHVNTDPRRRVRFVSADLNLVDILGVDRGAELEQIEAAPTWQDNDKNTNSKSET